MNTSLTNHETRLLVDEGAGVILEAPPTPVVSRRYVESHSFIVLVEHPGKAARVFAGRDAKAAAAGHTSNDNYIEYEVEREIAGFLHLRRVA